MIAAHTTFGMIHLDRYFALPDLPAKKHRFTTTRHATTPCLLLRLIPPRLTLPLPPLQVSPRPNPPIDRCTTENAKFIVLFFPNQNATINLQFSAIITPRPTIIVVIIHPPLPPTVHASSCAPRCPEATSRTVSHQARHAARPGAIAAGWNISLESVPLAAAAVLAPEIERAPQHAAHYPGV